MDLFDLFFVNIAYAAEIDTFIRNVNRLILNPLITLLFALAFVYFFYGVFEFISNQNNEEKKTAGKQHMIWGVIGLTIMVGVWGILSLLLKTFNITGIDPKAGTVNLPNYPQ